MATIRYTFRSSLFAEEQTVILDDSGLVAQHKVGNPIRLGWNDIAEVRLEPATAGNDDRTRWVLSLIPKAGNSIKIDSVDVKSATEFEHKSDEFLTVLDAIHRALLPRRDTVRFTLGVRRWVIVAWRIALVLVVLAGLFGCVAAVISEEYEALIGAGTFAAFGLLGLMLLKGKGGPKAYDPSDFIAARADEQKS